MKCNHLIKLALALLLTAPASLTSKVWGQVVPSMVNYQGRLTDQTGAALPAGPYTMQFRLWDTPTGSNTLVWAQQQNVAVLSNGVFNVILGAPGGTPVAGATPAFNNLAFSFSTSNRFLGVTVVSNVSGAIANESEILPRQQLLSVPFAVQAQDAQQSQVASSLTAAYANTLIPPGSIVAYMGTAAPSGWLLCDGSAVSRTTFPALFSAIGTSSGSGDNANTFNLPDLRGMFLRGVDGQRGLDLDKTNRMAGASGGNPGNLVGSVQLDSFAAHYHGTAINTPNNNPTLSAYGTGTQSAPNEYPVMWGSASGAPAPSQNSQSVGGTETRPKNVYVTYIIKY